MLNQGRNKCGNKCNLWAWNKNSFFWLFWNDNLVNISALISIISKTAKIRNKSILVTCRCICIYLYVCAYAYWPSSLFTNTNARIFPKHWWCTCITHALLIKCLFSFDVCFKKDILAVIAVCRDHQGKHQHGTYKPRFKLHVTYMMLCY